MVVIELYNKEVPHVECCSKIREAMVVVCNKLESKGCRVTTSIEKDFYPFFLEIHWDYHFQRSKWDVGYVSEMVMEEVSKKIPNARYY